jgi:lipopolysaccharide transport system permease protein
VNTTAELSLRRAGHENRTAVRAHSRIEPSTGWSSLKLRELWAYRELLYFFIWRDVKVRYKQAVLGASWAIIQPLFLMLVFTLFFGRLASIPSDGVPYAVFSYAGLLPWLFFASGLTQSTTSVSASAGLIKKIYFPRLLVPTATVFTGLIDLAVGSGVLVLLMLYYGLTPTLNVLWLPLFVLVAIITSLGVGLWLSALNVKYADVRHAVPFLVQFWMFATPIVYPSSLLDARWQTVYALNPMVGVVEGFRWAFLGTATEPDMMIAVSSLMALAILTGGAFYFRRMERQFADVM